MMKPMPARQHVDHASYRQHRRQMWGQILFPVLLAAAAFIIAPIAAWMTVMHGQGEVGRWAAISTMWLLIPVMIGGVILLVVLIGLVFVASRVHAWIPRFTYRAQRFAFRASDGTRRAGEMVRRPVLAVRAVGSLVKSRFQRLRERV
jgi:hypothetical protein